jgi:deoxyribodipyrimidine photo-lyase
MTKINQTVSVFWFRRDLRLNDNAGLYQALVSGFPVLPLFIFDTDILSQLEDKNDKRVDFVHQALEELQKDLAKAGSSLCVKIGKPIEVFEQLMAEYTIISVSCNRDYEPYALERDGQVRELLRSQSTEFRSFKDQVIHEPDEIVKSDGKPYTIYTPYSKSWKFKLHETSLRPYPCEGQFNNFLHLEQATIPSLQDIGFKKTDVAYSPPVIDEDLIRTYDETRNFPALKGSSELSTHIRFGTISIRKLGAIARETNETWLNELIWREFFMSILWHFPYVEKGPFKKKYNEIPWRNNEDEFKCWCEGRTGYPIVDAGMRQLNETGWMHNRVRMITASFLTKHLLIDWRWGEAYFAQKLLDYDLSANNGNWQWAAGCGCDAAPYFRIFNPAGQTKRFDPELVYIKKWVKELDTSDYPPPIVEHTLARNRALEAYKKGLNENTENR